MNKFLLASTALVLSAGFAAAEVTVGGDGRMGVVYDDSNDDNEFTFNSRIRISFTATGETDGGLQFGGSIRADNAPPATVNATVTDDNGLSPGDAGFDPNTVQVNNANSGGGVNGLAGSVFVSGAFGKLTMGDIDTAAKSAVGNVDGVGYTGIGDFNEVGHIGGGDDEGALYEYSFGAATFYASLGQIDGAQTGTGDTDERSIGLKYDAGTFYVAVGYVDVEDTGDQIAAGAGTSFAGFDLAAVYVTDDGSDNEAYAISAGGTFAGAGVTAFYRDGDDGKGQAYGIGASYDLGGGAALKGGIAHSDGLDQTKADFGVTLSF